MATPTASTNTPSKHLPTLSSPAPRSVPHTGNTNMLSYDSPAVLNMLTDPGSGMGGVGMGISMSGLGMSSLGMSASAMGRADEAERTRRLQNILELVGGKPGRVSEEGLLALCKKLGVSAEKNPDIPHGWMLLIGDEAVCDISFHNDEIATVNLQTNLDGEQEDLQFGPTGSDILVRSLKPLPGQSKINVTLERFAANLEKLLTLDKLSSPQNGGVSCYNAIAGVYTSLRKLFEHEKKMALALLDANTPYRSHKAEREVLCKKSGRPRLNGGSCLGLSLEYWMDRRHIIPQPSPPPLSKGKQKQNPAEQEIPQYPEDSAPEINKIYSLTIECEPSPSLYTPIRISTAWLSDPDTNDPDDPNTSHHPSWLDPKPTYLDPSTSRLPSTRFVAILSPPLILPLAVAIHIQQSLALTPRAFRPTTFPTLLRPDAPESTSSSFSSAGPVLRATRGVRMPGDRDPGTIQIHTHLYTPRTEYAVELERLAFAHPKQIIALLPVLRQYACATSLVADALRRSCPASTTPSTTLRGMRGAGNECSLHVSLAYAPPAPRLGVLVTRPEAEAKPHAVLDNAAAPADDPPRRPLSIALDILPDAQIVVREQNVFADGHGEDKVARALDVCADLAVWAVWLRAEGAWT